METTMWFVFRDILYFLGNRLGNIAKHSCVVKLENGFVIKCPPHRKRSC